MVQLLQRNVFQVVLALKHFLQIADSSFVSQNRAFHIITVYQFPVFLVMLTEHLQEHLRGFTLTIKFLYHSESRDRLAVLQQFAMYLINLRPDRFQILVQFQRFPVFACHTSFGCIPTLFGNAALDLHFGTLPVYGDSQPDGCLAVFQQSCSSDKEENREIVSLHGLILFLFAKLSSKAESATTQNSVYQRKATLFGGLFRSESYSTELACESCRILRERGR